MIERQLSYAPDGRRAILRITRRRITTWERQFPDVDIHQAIQPAMDQAVQFWNARAAIQKMERYFRSCQGRRERAAIERRQVAKVSENLARKLEQVSQDERRQEILDLLRKVAS